MPRQIRRVERAARTRLADGVADEDSCAAQAIKSIGGRRGFLSENLADRTVELLITRNEERQPPKVIAKRTVVILGARSKARFSAVSARSN